MVMTDNKDFVKLQMVLFEYAEQGDLLIIETQFIEALRSKYHETKCK